MRPAILLSLLRLGSGAAVSAPETTEERNKALARRFYQQVRFSRNLSAVGDLVAPEYVVHDTGDGKGVTEAAGEQKNIADFFGNCQGTAFSVCYGFWDRARCLWLSVSQSIMEAGAAA